MIAFMMTVNMIPPKMTAFKMKNPMTEKQGLSKGWVWLQGAPGGVLRNRHDTYKAAEDMMASLGDQYSQFLPPSQVLFQPFLPMGCCRAGEGEKVAGSKHHLLVPVTRQVTTLLHLVILS